MDTLKIGLSAGMKAPLGDRWSLMVAESLLCLRRNLANSEFLQHHVFTLDESRFVDSTYVYWIRLRREHDTVKDLDIFPTDIPQDIQEELNRELSRKVFERMPKMYSNLVKLSPQTRPEDSVRACAAQRDQRIAEELPTCVRYAICYSEINRLVRKFDAELETRPNAEEFAALFDHLSRYALKQARSRFPEMWDEVKGHYILDSRGTRFATAFATGLKTGGHLVEGSRFIDLGSGTGTIVVAVNHYTEAHATGVEKHAGVMRLAKALIRRLGRKRCLREDRIEFIVGDFFQTRSVDLAQYDVLHVYSPIGKWEIDVDVVIDRMRPGAILATSKNPQRGIALVDKIEPVGGLSCFRKIKEFAAH